MGEHTELRRNISKNDNKIKQEFNDKTLAWYRYKQKKNLWATFQTTVHSTQSQNLVSKLIAAISIKLVFVKLPPGQALNLCVKFSKFLFLTASSLSLSLI